MKDLIISIFGDYVPVTYEHIYIVGDDTIIENVIPAGLAGCDWTYILGVVAFLVVLYCILRIIGGVITRV